MGRSTGAAGKDPTSPQLKLVEHADVRRMLLAQKSYVEGGLAFNLWCAKLVDEANGIEDDATRESLTLLLDLLTPIAKSWPSQWCLAANDLAIQVHGGYGYTREYNVEQFYRDNRLNPIHEGTHGIHGLDLLGRKVVIKEGAALKLFVQRVQASLECARSNGDAQDAAHARALEAAMQRLVDVTQQLWSAGDPGVTLANASVYLEAFGHVVIAWIWLEQAFTARKALKNAPDNEAGFYRGKLAAAQYFFAWELPKTTAQFDLLASLDRTTLDMQDAWF